MPHRLLTSGEPASASASLLEMLAQASSALTPSGVPREPPPAESGHSGSKHALRYSGAAASPATQAAKRTKQAATCVTPDGPSEAPSPP